MGYPALHVAQQQFVPADPQEDVLTPHLPLRLQLPQPPHAVLRAAQLPLQAKGQQVLRGPRRRYGALWGAMGYSAPHGPVAHRGVSYLHVVLEVALGFEQRLPVVLALICGAVGGSRRGGGYGEGVRGGPCGAALYSL